MRDYILISLGALTGSTIMAINTSLLNSALLALGLGIIIGIGIAVHDHWRPRVGERASANEGDFEINDGLGL